MAVGLLLRIVNGKTATLNRTLDGSTYPGIKLLRSLIGKIYYGGLKRNSLYFGTGTAIWWVTEPHFANYC